MQTKYETDCKQGRRDNATHFLDPGNKLECLVIRPAVLSPVLAMAAYPILVVRAPAATSPAASLCKNSSYRARSAKSVSAEFCFSKRYQNCSWNSPIGSRFRGIPCPRSSSGSASVSMAEDATKALKVDGGATENGSSTSTRQNVLHFAKYHGLGNDFLLVDNRDSMTPKISPEQSIRLCDRNFGVGGDGVIFVLPGTDGSDYTMRIYNSDGSEPEMCGNGIRCIAKFVAELEGATEARSYKISTLGGLIVPKLQDDGQVCVDMGPPILEASKIPTTLSPSENGAVVKVPLSVDGKIWNVTCVSMGNPHCITILDDTEVLDDLRLSSIGPLFEHHEVFPSRTNTEFIQILSRSHIRMRVWERGAGATLACGTGACALVVAAVLEGRTERKCLVELPGGPLQIEWREDDNHLYMTGPAQLVFIGDAIL